MNLNYLIEKVNSEWELTVILKNIKSNEHLGYLNQENDVMTIACPEEQYGNIFTNYTPYSYPNLKKLMEAINKIETEKQSIIDCYLTKKCIYLEM